MAKILNAGYNEKKIVSHAHKQYLYIDSEPYLDFSLCSGTNIFGHAPDFLTNKLIHQIAWGTAYGLPNTTAQEYAKEFSKHVPLESMVFCNSGSEAVMRAFRIARAYTKKPKIAIFEGSWHGSYDGTVFQNFPTGINPQDVIVFPKDKSFHKLINLKNEIAMIFVEPFQGSNPQSDKQFMNTLQKYCRAYGILLGFDEIISGFRYPGINHYNIIPDIATYGKIAGGGFPIGIVAGKKEVMNVVNKGVFMGGTFSGNPITLTAGLEVMKRITPQVKKDLLYNADYLKTEVNSGSKNLMIMGVGSFLRLVFMKTAPINCADRDKNENKKLKERVYKKLFDKKIYLGSNGLIFLSTEHTKMDIEKLAGVLCQS